MRRIICTLAVAVALLTTPAGFAQQRLYASHKARSSGGVTAVPAFSPAGSTYNTAQSVTMSDPTTGAVIYYTTDGTTPTTSSRQYSGPISVTQSATLKAMAVETGLSKSAVATAAYVISVPTTPVTTNSPSYGIGFTSSGLTLNGGASISGNRLRITDGGASEARSAFFTAPVNIQSFTNNFSFQLTNANADGFTFTIQGDGATALGRTGGRLGYGGLVSSAAVKFDLYNNAGEGNDSTGLFTNGVIPTIPSSDMSGSGIDLHSGDVMNVQMTYDGTTLTWTIKDATAGTQYQTSSAVNIPSLIGSNTAYVGFTGGTGGLTATQDILTWTFVPGAALSNSVVPATSPTQPTPVSVPQITTSSVPSGAVNVSYSATLAATSGVAPYTWSVSGGQLAPGLTLQGSTGQITGTPSQAGTFSFSIKVTDSSNQTASANFSANIAPLASPVISSISPSSGPTAGGTTVTINGSNFQAGAAVTFGGTAASSVTVFSSSQIRVVTPSHLAGAVGVMVQENGQSSSSASFNYNAIAPTVSSISPNDGPTAGGTSVILSGANFLTGATVLFGSAQASNVTVVSATQIQAVTPANAAGLTNVAVENPGSLSASLASGFTYNASQTGPPTISSVSPTSGAPGTQITITGSNFNSADVVSFGSTNATPTTFVSTTQMLASVPSVSAGKYNVNVTDPDPASVTLNNGFTVMAPAPAQSLLSGCTVNSSNLPSCTTPAGWTLAAAQGFETGSIASDQAINATVNCSFGHSGNCSESASISYQGAADQWFFDEGQLIGHEFYLSYYDWASGGSVNEEYALAHAIKHGLGGTAGFQEIIPDLVSTTTYNNLCPNYVVFSQGNYAANDYRNTSCYFSAAWTQWEIWIRANTPGNSDGFIRIYKNGSVAIDLENMNLNGTNDMTGMQVEAGGWYTKNVWTNNGQFPSAGSCSAGPGQGSEAGSWQGAFGTLGSGDCAPAPPVFTRYIDDIVLLQK